MTNEKNPKDKNLPKKKILLVDDEPAILKIVKLMLTRMEYEVETTESAQEALKILEEDFSFDCVVTDAIMPKMDGYEMVRTIRQRPELASLPILMLTRKRDRQDVKAAMDAGVSDYVLKPIDEHLLLDKVEACMKKGDGKRHIFDLSLTGDNTLCHIKLAGRMISMSESGVVLRVSIPIFPDLKFQFLSPVFAEIGIAVPLLKPQSFEKIENSSDDLLDCPYEIKLSFLGMDEPDLKKIRAWLHREASKRRK